MSDIISYIHSIRDLQVMLDEDLALLYGVPTKRLNEQVKRNKERFPGQFYFRLTKIEYDTLKSRLLKSQFATSNKKGGRQYRPFAFTEQGVAMLSGVLKSKTAVRVSIQIVSEFVAMRRIISANSQIFTRLEIVEQKQLDADKKFNQIFDALSSRDDIPKQKIFFEDEIFDAHEFVSRIIKSAQKDLILIDSFIDEKVLSIFTKCKNNVRVTIFTKKISPTLAIDIEKHNSQYSKIEVREFNLAHDRFIVVDQKEIYHFGASIKDLGKKWFVVSKLEESGLLLLNRLTKNNI